MLFYVFFFFILNSGASALGSVFRDTDEAESIRVVHKAIENGINYIDTAPWYGHGKSETVLGKVLYLPFLFFPCCSLLISPCQPDITLRGYQSGTQSHREWY